MSFMNQIICDFADVETDAHHEAVKQQGTTKKVFFLKMHKSASSTVASILSYWGLRNHMTFALPKGV